MPDLLVPGTCGCKLTCGGEDIGWPLELKLDGLLSGRVALVRSLRELLGGRDPEAVVTLLSMRFGPPERPTPEATSLGGEVMGCGEVLRLAYNQFTDFQVFAYDWRSDIRESAARLLERLQGGAGPGRRWRILAHSQGGLVVVAASKLLSEQPGNDDRSFARLVSHVVLLATPLYGTVSAAEALLVGDGLGAPFRDAFRRIVRTWPAIYQMLPVWPGCVRTPLPHGRSEATTFNLLDDEPWDGEAVDRAMLKRARLTRKQALNNPLSRMNDVKVQLLVSRSLPTRDHVLLADGRLTLPEADALGDGLVPEEATYRLLRSVERERTHALGGGTGSTLQHFALANDPVVATAIQAFFGS